MQTIEAMISFLVLVSITSSCLSQMSFSEGTDSSLYKYQLVNDVWRVFYLRGDFEYFSSVQRDALEQDAEIIREKTGLCIFLEGVRYTNCRGGNTHEKVSTVEKYVYEDGEVKKVTLTIAR